MENVEEGGSEPDAIERWHRDVDVQSRRRTHACSRCGAAVEDSRVHCTMCGEHNASYDRSYAADHLGSAETLAQNIAVAALDCQAGHRERRQHFMAVPEVDRHLIRYCPNCGGEVF